MSMNSTTVPDWSYRPGPWFAIVGSGATVLLPASHKESVVALWSLVDDGAGFDEVLDALLAAGLRSLPAFAVVSGEAEPTRVLLRGVAVHAEVVSDAGAETLDGVAGGTWVERTFPSVTSLRILIDEVDLAAEASEGTDGDTGADAASDAAGVDLPIVAGLVRVSRLDRPVAQPRTAPVVAASPVGVDDEDAPVLLAADPADAATGLDDVEPDTAQPDTEESDTEESDTEESDTEESDTEESDTEESDTEESDTEGSGAEAAETDLEPTEMMLPVAAEAADDASGDPLGDPLTDPLSDPLADPLDGPLDDPLHTPLGDEGDELDEPGEPDESGELGEPGDIEAPAAETLDPPDAAPAAVEAAPFDDWLTPDHVGDVDPSDLPAEERAVEPSTGEAPETSFAPGPPPPPTAPPADLPPPPLGIGSWEPVGGPPPPPGAPPVGTPPPAAPVSPPAESPTDDAPPSFVPARGGEPVVATLVISDGQTVPVDGVVLIGRAPEARRFTATEQPRLVTVPSRQHEISSTHVEVRPGTGGDFGAAVVTDMGSTNGTVLVQPGRAPEDLKPGIAVALAAGAVIDLGDGITIQVGHP